MASYQRVALFIIFDALESDLNSHIRGVPLTSLELSDDETQKSQARASKTLGQEVSDIDRYEQIAHLDIGDKFNILMRNRSLLPTATSNYFKNKGPILSEIVPIRNALMHGRPLTTAQFSRGFVIANDFVKSPHIWPNVHRVVREYDRDPQSFLSKSITILDSPAISGVLHNLPSPDYDDTGFLARPSLEAEIKSKILGRPAVVTLLGDGGNGKTALALQTLYNLADSSDNKFEAILWVTAKANKLTNQSIEEIQGAFKTSTEIFKNIADLVEPGDYDPMVRLRKLMSESKILLAIDNLETILDESVMKLAEDVPGESKILFTSRVPLGSDVLVNIGELTSTEARNYARRLIDAYSVNELRATTPQELEGYCRRLHNKPLLIKWFVHGVASGSQPDRILANPDIALRFCLENVVDKLSMQAKLVAGVLNTAARPLSMNIIEALIRKPIEEVELGIGQLARYSLLDTESSITGERNYLIRPFARAYLSRFAKIQGVDPQDISSQLRRLEADFQSRRSLHSFDRYDPRQYTVRTRPELLCYHKLRQAAHFAMDGRFEESFALVRTAKIGMPSYFEVYRTEAFVASESGDFGLANDAYEAAIDVDNSQPQIIYFYANFLVKSYNYEKAAELYRKAIELDPNCSILPREAARVEMLMGNFESARSLIEKSKSLKGQTIRDEIILLDIEVQIITRSVDQCMRAKRLRDAIDICCDLCDLILNIPPGRVDSKLASHIQSGVDLAYELINVADDIGQSKLAIVLGKVLDGKSSEWLRPQYGNISVSGVRKSVGKLKSEGRQLSFGFLRDMNDVDTFVHRSEVEVDVWQHMISGEAVEYEILTDGEKTRAFNVTRIRA
jgi:tetratricopeptide (TPR) repeat protein/cold shock CspA family protein